MGLVNFYAKNVENGPVFPLVQPTTFATVICRPQNFHCSIALDNGYRTVPVCAPVHAYSKTSSRLIPEYHFVQLSKKKTSSTFLIYEDFRHERTA